MGKNLAPDTPRKVIALLALLGTLLFQSVFTSGCHTCRCGRGFILFKNNEEMISQHPFN